jgi:hypothetical protein
MTLPEAAERDDVIHEKTGTSDDVTIAFHESGRYPVYHSRACLPLLIPYRYLQLIMCDKSVLHHVTSWSFFDFDMTLLYLILVYSAKSCYLRFCYKPILGKI